MNILNKRKARRNIDDMQNLASKHNGKCLSEKYIGAHMPLLWQCNKEHIFSLIPNKVQQGGWCPYCTGHGKTIDDMQMMALDRGGRVISKEFKGVKNHLKWECGEGHIFLCTPDNVSHGRWCPHCSMRVKKTIDDMQKLATCRGGKCLSEEYVNNHTVLKWECCNHHIFLNNYTNVIRGQWCPKCKVRIGEEITRKYFENIFDKIFLKFRPIWLKNERSYQMELDGYNEELGIAFEYQGQQHYKLSSWYNNNDKLQKRIKDDKFKKRICNNNGVILIVIPYFIDYNDIGKYIYKELKKKKISILKSYDDVLKIDYKKFGIYNVEKIDRMRELASKNNGQCISNFYVNNHVKIEWKCDKNHIFLTTPRIVSRGSWCPICANEKRRKLDKVAVL